MKFSFALVTALCVAQTAAFSVQGPSSSTASTRSTTTTSLMMSSVPGAYQLAIESANANAERQRQQQAASMTMLEPAWNGSSQTASMEAAMANSAAAANNHHSPRSIFETLEPPVTVQGGSLRTWSFTNPHVRRVRISLRTEGRPLNANVDLWQGPDNAPHKMSVYIEDGSVRPFLAVVETPGMGHNAIALRNTGQMEFPLQAGVQADVGTMNGDMDNMNQDSGAGQVIQELLETSLPEIVQGGAIKTYSFDPTVASVQILLKTDGRPLNARIELLQGPNNNKQVIELYTEDGMDRPFYSVLETPGVGNVVRIVNTAPVEFPMHARVEPYEIVDESELGLAMPHDWDSGQTLFGRR